MRDALVATRVWKVDHVEQRGLQQLALEEGTGDPEHRLVREDHGALGHRIDVEAEIQFTEMGEKLPRRRALGHRCR